MSSIIRYIFDMLPFMLAVLPIHVTVRLIVARKTAFDPRREAALLVFVLFLAGLASQTVIPKIRFTGGELLVINDGVHTTNIIPLKVFIDTYVDVFRYGNIGSFIINFLGNIVMFMPIGFFVPLLWNASGKRVVLVGFLCSLFIELSQLILPRSSDVDDLILNSLGTLLGFLLYKLLECKLQRFATKFKK